MQINQNFSIPAGDDGTIAFDVDPSVNIDTIIGCELFWMVYAQSYGVPVPGAPALISKTNVNSYDIIIPESPPLRFYVELYGDDTVGLLRNYWHEACLFDASANKITITVGIMTVTATENRPTP